MGIIDGGGSGHGPYFLDHAGEHMLDAVAIGEVFSSPFAIAFHQAFLETDTDAGAACLFGNHAGDNTNVKTVVQVAAIQQVNVRYVTASDDTTNASLDEREKRHGVAGSLFTRKIEHAEAELGGTLDEVIDAVQATVNRTGSLCIRLVLCSVPAIGYVNSETQEGIVKYGIGHHSEPGLTVELLKSVEEVTTVLCERIEAGLKLRHGEEISVIVSRPGGTPIMELYVLYDKIENYFAERGISVYRSLIGNCIASLEMSGTVLTVMRVKEEFKELLDFPADTPAITIK